MGRFDELTKLDEAPPKQAPKKLDTEAIEKDLKKQTAKDDLKGSAYFPEKTSPAQVIKQQVGKKPEIMKSGNHEKSTPLSTQQEKPEKYSTLLHSDRIKKLKLHATELDMKDYECLEMILDKYFENRS
jgi:hypothetical protein